MLSVVGVDLNAVNFFLGNVIFSNLLFLLGSDFSIGPSWGLTLVILGPRVVNLSGTESRLSRLRFSMRTMANSINVVLTKYKETKR